MIKSLGVLSISIFIAIPSAFSASAGTLPFATCDYDDSSTATYFRIGRFYVKRAYSTFAEIEGEIKLRKNGRDTYGDLGCIHEYLKNPELRCRGSIQGKIVRIRVHANDQHIGLMSLNEIDLDQESVPAFSTVDRVLPIRCQ